MKYDFFASSNNTNNDFDLLMKDNLKSAALFYLDKNKTITERTAKVLYESYKQLLPFAIERGLPRRYQNHPFIYGDEGEEKGLLIAASGKYYIDADKLYKKVISNYEGKIMETSIFDQIRKDASVPLDVSAARYFHGPGTHMCVDTEAIILHGYLGLIDRINLEMENANSEKSSFLRGLLYTCEALIEYFDKCADEYDKLYIESNDPEILKLATSIRKVPRYPCKTFFEGILVFRLMIMICYSEPNRMDKILYPLYLMDIEAGNITRDKAKKYLDDSLYFINEDTTNEELYFFHMTIGGCDSSGAPCYNELTKIILENINTYAHPHISLRVNENMSDDFWDLALEKIGNGKANPALVNEDVFIKDLVENYNIPIEDARDFSFGGCSETLITGKTNVGSTWVAYNSLDILNDCVYRNLSICKSYNEFLQLLKNDYEITINELVEHINLRQHMPAAWLADPIISLHVGGCIERGKSFWAGGAKYNFDSTNIYGVANVINSLVSLKAFFDGTLNVDANEFLEALKGNFENSPDLLHKIKRLPKFGNGNEMVQAIAKDISEHIFGCVTGKRCYRGNGYFMPSIISWVTYVTLGYQTNATPDGRLKEQPLGDSCGAVAGTDINGPTALLSDCSFMPHHHGAGTLVVNIKLSPECFNTSISTLKVRNLFEGYFKMGGTQLQVNVFDKELLLAALKNPEDYKNIIIRVGGFSDYFYRQSEDIRKVIVDRITHST